MNWHYAYTLYIWPMLAWVGFVAALSLYVKHRRTVPGALSFAMLMSLWSLLAIDTLLELAPVDILTRIFGSKFQFFLLGPTAAGLYFVLTNAHFNRSLTRRGLLRLFIGVLLKLINEIINNASCCI